jgi:hypothetical protein
MLSILEPRFGFVTGAEAWMELDAPPLRERARKVAGGQKAMAARAATNTQ